MGDFSADFDMWVIQLDSALVESCWHVAIRGDDRDAHNPFASWSVPLGERLAGRAIVDVAGCAMRELSELAAAVWHAAQPATARRALRELSALALRVTLASVDQRRAPSLAELASCLSALSARHRSPRRRRRARRQRRVPVAHGSSRSGRDVRRTARADARRAFPGARPAGTPEPARGRAGRRLRQLLAVPPHLHPRVRLASARLPARRPPAHGAARLQRSAPALSGSVVALPHEQRQRAPL